MDKVLLDLHQVLEQGRQVINAYQIKEKDISKREILVIAREKSLDQKEKAFADREASVSKIENIQKLHQDAEALLNRANLRVEVAISTEKKLRDLSAQETAKLNDLRLITQREADCVTKRSKQIDEEVKAKVDEFLKTGGWKK